MSKHTSVRRQLTIYLLSLIGLSAALSTVWVYRDAKHEVEELFDASLTQSARVLHGMITRENITTNKQHLLDSLSDKSSEIDRYDDEATPEGHKYEKKLAFQIWSDVNNLLLQSDVTLNMPLSKLERGFSNLTNELGDWRTFTLYSEQDKYWLIVAERDDIRQEITHKIARDHIVPLVLFLPLLAWLIWKTIGQAFRPIRKIAEEVAAQDYAKLSGIEGSEVPLEVSGLLEEINQLFSRLNKSYQREQRFVSDAAHELRNPLAGLLVHTENLLTEAKHNRIGEEVIGPVQHIHSGAQRLSGLVSQLLLLSRADTDDLTKHRVGIDLAVIAEDVCQDITPLSDRKRIQCDIEISTYHILGNPDLIAALLRNLLQNAINYSPANSPVLIECKRRGDRVELLVQDSGPGINPAEREQVLQRFYRLEPFDNMGSGLGLAIVAQIANLHDAQLNLDSSKMGGLLVRVSFAATT